MKVDNLLKFIFAIVILIGLFTNNAKAQVPLIGDKFVQNQETRVIPNKKFVQPTIRGGSDYLANVAGFEEVEEYKLSKHQSLNFFLSVGASGVQDNQNALLVSRRKALTIGPSFTAGGFFQTNETSLVFASATFAQIFDHEYDKTTHMIYDLGAMYTMGYFNIGAGLRALTRPQQNQGDIGVMLKAMFLYPLGGGLRFLASVDYGAPIIERTTKSVKVGIAYTLPN